jgi:hypothetical protein
MTQKKIEFVFELGQQQVHIVTAEHADDAEKGLE